MTALDARASDPAFWDDQRAAQAVLREAEGLRDEIALWRSLEKRATDLLELLSLLDESPDPETEADVDREAADLEKIFQRERTLLLFSGEYDAKNAVLTISAGAGGTEATDWAEMLLRMYLRWAERHRFKTDVVDSTEGEQAGIKSATVTIDGRFAFGWLRAERGVHRLVRISPYDAQKRRQTTFALVEIMPEADDDVEIELNWDEIRVDTFRSSGAGGQHVQKTESAIRLTHLPTGIVVTCQNERSATQNRELATRVLKSRLLELEIEKREDELRKLRGEHVTAGWGNQIRSYVLHPYQMVKDLRTGFETSNTSGVLDGDLDMFMQAELERVATGRPPSSSGDDESA
ncbi:MAG: peptide chain release factor 2 [Chloroflexota bacterium]|nr:MAG: peptide chain release factor 2 [Chloroflexota bacterium]